MDLFSGKTTLVMMMSMVVGASVFAAEPATGTFSAEGSPYQVEIRTFDYPPGFETMHSHWRGLNMGVDGNCYIGVGDHKKDAHLYKFDPRTQILSDVGNVQAAIPSDRRNREDHGKIHVKPFQTSDGNVYFGTHFGKSSPEFGGRIFRYVQEKGIEHLGHILPRQTVMYMFGNEEKKKLYIVTHPSAHFLVWDIEKNTFEDKGTIAGKPGRCGAFDSAGNHYLDCGEQIKRYNPKTDKIEIASGNPCHWVGIVMINDVAYVAAYKTAALYSFSIEDWPTLKIKKLGNIDPQNRALYSANLSVTPDNKLLTVIGNWGEKNGPKGQGVFVYEIETGKKILVAEITDYLTQAMGTDMTQQKAYITNANTVDKDGWIYLGIHTGGDKIEKREKIVKFIACRVTAK